MNFFTSILYWITMGPSNVITHAIPMNTFGYVIGAVFMLAVTIIGWKFLSFLQQGIFFWTTDVLGFYFLKLVLSVIIGLFFFPIIILAWIALAALTSRRSQHE